MTILFSNNATSRLTIATPAASGTITLPSGDGAQFPAPGAGDAFLVTIEDRRTNQMEICRCTARVGDVLTVTRAQEGTVAQDFLIGATVSNRMTAGTLAVLQQAYLKPEADAKFVDVAGDVMTGPLTLPGVPTTSLEAANKGYVDTGLGTKAPTVHTHPMTDVTGLVTALATKEVLAPIDGAFYGRKGATWQVPLTADIPGLQAQIDAKLGEAPQDGTIYGRRNASWTAVLTDWGSITGKPSTFPPTLPIAEVDVTNLVADLAARLTDAPLDGAQYARAAGAWAVVTGGGSGGGIPEAPTDGQLYGRKSSNWFVVPATPTWSTLTGKPSTFPPTLPIAQSDVTALVADQAAQNTSINSKEPIIVAGTSAQFWRGDKTWQPLSSITVDAWTKAEADARFEPIDTMYTKAESDIRYELKVTLGTTGQYWRGDKSWQTLDKTAVGLGNVDNTSDVNKPVSTAQAASIATKENSLPAGGTTSNWLRGDKTWQPIVSGGAKMTCSTTAPVSPTDNDLWWHTDLAALFVRYNDGTSTAWVQIG